MTFSSGTFSIKMLNMNILQEDNAYFIILKGPFVISHYELSLPMTIRDFYFPLCFILLGVQFKCIYILQLKFHQNELFSA